jgi:general secretion pathway protein G
MQMRGKHGKMNGRHGGFTLLEVLLVVVILGMLAALVVPNLITQGDRARINLAKTVVSNGGPIAGAINLYKLHMGRFPDKLEDLTTLPEDPAERAKYGAEPYIPDPESLKDPWGQEVQYKCPGEINKDRFDLYSFGPDMKEGGGDDIGNWTTASR